MNDCVLECVGTLIFNNVSEEIPQHKMPLRKINDKRSIELSTLWLRVVYVYVPLILSLKTWLPMWMCAWFWIYFRCRDLLSLAAACRCRRHATCLSDHIGQSHHPYRAVIIHAIWWCTLLLRRCFLFVPHLVIVWATSTTINWNTCEALSAHTVIAFFNDRRGKKKQSAQKRPPKQLNLIFSSSSCNENHIE